MILGLQYNILHCSNWSIINAMQRGKARPLV